MPCIFQGERGLPGRKGDRGKPGIKVFDFSYKSSLCFETFVVYCTTKHQPFSCSSNITIFVSRKSNYESRLANFVSALIVVQALTTWEQAIIFALIFLS